MQAEGRSAIIGALETENSGNESVINGLADELLKYKRDFEMKLYSEEGISLDELSQCQNLNPYRDWFISMLEEANQLSNSIDDHLVSQIE